MRIGSYIEIVLLLRRFLQKSKLFHIVTLADQYPKIKMQDYIHTFVLISIIFYRLIVINTSPSFEEMMRLYHKFADRIWSLLPGDARNDCARQFRLNNEEFQVKHGKNI